MINKKDTKLALLGMVVTLSIILSCVILYYAGEFSYRMLFKKSIRIEYFKNRLSAEVNRINSVIRSNQNTLMDLSNILEFRNTTEAEKKILLKSVLFNKEELFGCAISCEPYVCNKDSLYYSIYAYRQNDSILFTNLNDPEYNYFYKDWYLIPKTLQKPVWSEPYFDIGGGNTLMTTYSVPFFSFKDNKEKFYGVLTIDVSIDWLTRAIASYGKELNKYAILISENGTILSGPVESMALSETIFTIAEEKKLPALREIGRDLQQGKSGHKEIEDIDGKNKWIAIYATISTNKWGLIFLIPENELLKSKISFVK
jgi:sigma-B regulation protein RsbU (phosphoserine phosphatase)